MPSGMDSCATGKLDGAGCRVWGLCRNQHLPHHCCCPESLLSWGKAAELVAQGLAQSSGCLCWKFMGYLSLCPSTARPAAEEVDVMLQRCEGGVDAALQYAKTISKYMKDLIGYMEKRICLGEWWDSRGVSSGAGLRHRTG